MAAAPAAVVIWISAAGQLSAADQWDWLCGRALVFLHPAAVFRGQQWQHKAHNWLEELAVHWGGSSATSDFIANCEAQRSWLSLCHLLRKNIQQKFLLLWTFLSWNFFYCLINLPSLFFWEWENREKRLSIRGDIVHICKVCAKQGCNWKKFIFTTGHFLCQRWQLPMVILYFLL